MANILVYVETREHGLHPLSLWVVSRARRVASQLGATVYGVVPCAEPPPYGEDDIIVQISRAGADKVILLADPCLEGPGTFETHGRALLTACKRFPPALLLCANTACGRDVAHGCAAALEAAIFLEPEFPEDVATEPIRQHVAGSNRARQLRLLSAERTVVVVTRGEPPSREASEDAEVVVLPAGCGERAPRFLGCVGEGSRSWKPPEKPTLLVLGSLAGPAALWKRAAESLGAEIRFTAAACLEGSGVPDEILDPSAEFGPFGRMAFVGERAPGRVSGQLGGLDACFVGEDSEGIGPAWMAAAPEEIAAGLLGGEEVQASEEDGGTTENPGSIVPDAETQVVLLAGPKPEEVPREVYWQVLDPAIRAAQCLGFARKTLVCCCHADEWPGLPATWQGIRVDPPRAGPIGIRGLSRILARAVERLEGRLVLAGPRGMAWGRGAVPAAVAARLGWPYLGSAVSIVRTPEGLQAERFWNGTLWRWLIEEPAVVAVGAWRRGSGKLDVAPGDPVVWTLEDLDLSMPDLLPLCRPLSEAVSLPGTSGRRLETAREFASWLKHGA